MKIKSALLKALRRYRASFSQAGQDLWVAQEVFNEQEDLFFVDAGAYDGIGLSNTYLLETRYSWKGICIEANPKIFERLEKNRACHLAYCLLGSRHKTKNFILRDMASTVIKNNLKDSISIKCSSLAEVLVRFQSPRKIDYLSMDIEGSEDEVLEDFPFDTYFFRSATIERLSERGKKELRKQGYILIKEVKGLDAFFVHESHFKEYIKNMFSFYEKIRYVFP